MSSPYRDAIDSAEKEAIPAFRVPQRNLRLFGVLTAFILVLGIPEWRSGHHDSAIVAVALHIGALALSMVICVLDRPVRALLERRYARKVARGIVELETRASRIGSEHEA